MVKILTAQLNEIKEKKIMSDAKAEAVKRMMQINLMRSLLNEIGGMGDAMKFKGFLGVIEKELPKIDLELAEKTRATLEKAKKSNAEDAWKMRGEIYAMIKSKMDEFNRRVSGLGGQLKASETDIFALYENIRNTRNKIIELITDITATRQNVTENLIEEMKNPKKFTADQLLKRAEDQKALGEKWAKGHDMMADKCRQVKTLEENLIKKLASLGDRLSELPGIPSELKEKGLAHYRKVNGEMKKEGQRLEPAA